MDLRQIRHVTFPKDQVRGAHLLAPPPPASSRLRAASSARYPSRCTLRPRAQEQGWNFNPDMFLSLFLGLISFYSFSFHRTGSSPPRTFSNCSKQASPRGGSPRSEHTFQLHGLQYAEDLLTLGLGSSTSSHRQGLYYRQEQPVFGPARPPSAI